MPRFTLTVNNFQKEVEVESETPLLYVLRDHLKLNGPKFGCGLGQCGACMVLIDDRAVLSCMLPVSSIANSSITTLEGLAKDDNDLHPVQKAFVKEQAAQCGYCLNGMVMSTVSLLKRNPNPDTETIKNALQINLCRCSAHSRIIKAVKTAQNL